MSIATGAGICLFLPLLWKSKATRRFTSMRMSMKWSLVASSSIVSTNALMNQEPYSEFRHDTYLQEGRERMSTGRWALQPPPLTSHAPHPSPRNSGIGKDKVCLSGQGLLAVASSVRLVSIQSLLHHPIKLQRQCTYTLWPPLPSHFSHLLLHCFLQLLFCWGTGRSIS